MGTRGVLSFQQQDALFDIADALKNNKVLLATIDELRRARAALDQRAAELDARAADLDRREAAFRGRERRLRQLVEAEDR